MFLCATNSEEISRNINCPSLAWTEKDQSRIDLLNFNIYICSYSETVNSFNDPMIDIRLNLFID